MEGQDIVFLLTLAVVVVTFLFGLFIYIKEKRREMKRRPVSRKFLHVGIGFFALGLVLYYVLFSFGPVSSCPQHMLPFIVMVIPFAIGITLLRAYFWSRPLPKP